MNLGGVPVYVSSNVTEFDGFEETIVKRSLRERLFSRPWHPLKATKRVRTPRYKPAMVLAEGRLLCHPALLEQLEKQWQRHSST